MDQSDESSPRGRIYELGTDAKAATDAALPLMQATAHDGRRLLLVVQRLGSPTCTVYRDDDPIFTSPADEIGIDAAVDLLLRAADAGFRRLSK